MVVSPACLTKDGATRKFASDGLGYVRTDVMSVNGVAVSVRIRCVTVAVAFEVPVDRRQGVLLLARANNLSSVPLFRCSGVPGKGEYHSSGAVKGTWGRIFQSS